MKRARGSGSPKRRGGLRQRLRAQEAREELKGESALCRLLLGLFAWGTISAQLAQELAEAAYKDASAMKNGETNLNDLKRIGEIGCSGTYSNKCYGDIMKCIPYKIQIPEVTGCSIPFKAGLNSLWQSFLLPHQLFAAIYEHYPGAWSKSIMPSAARLRQFWSTNISHPTMTGNPLADRADLRDRIIPISFHGDDVPITGVGKSWCSQMTVFSWSSQIGFGTTRNSQFFVWGVFDKLRNINPDQSLDTLGRFFKVLAWSLHWLSLGQWPDRDWNGKLYLHMNLGF